MVGFETRREDGYCLTLPRIADASVLSISQVSGCGLARIDVDEEDDGEDGGAESNNACVSNSGFATR